MSAGFRLGDGLPTGTTVLEASAGTGKTYAIAGLTARFVAEGVVGIDQILVLTFSRMATRELRERVRLALTRSAEALRDPAKARKSPDELVAALVDHAEDAEVAARQRRLQAAVVGFDGATIATIHQFSTRMLGLLGMTGDLDEADRFDARPDDLVDDIVEEQYLASTPELLGGPLPPAVAAAIARGPTGGDPDALLLPAPLHAAGDAAVRVAWVDRVRHEVDERRRTSGRVGWDQQLTRLRDVLVDTAHGRAAVDRLRERYRVTLVDEFQDTDPVQWDILRTIAAGHGPLVLIGDPKQAIYGFRGADVPTYLAAAETAAEARSLDHNWRSDPDTVAGLARLLGAAELGDARIAVRPVASGRAQRATTSRLTGAGTAVQLRVMSRGVGRRSKDDLLLLPSARPAIAADLVRHAVRLLSPTVQLHPDGHDARPLRPADVAVLVRSATDADLVRNALTEAGVPAVVASARDVFESDAARDWQDLLDAMDEPGRPALFHTAAAGTLLGLPAQAVAEGGAALDDALRTVRTLRPLWAERGVLAVLDGLVREGLAQRLTGQVGGDRTLTDLRHVAEQLHTAASTSRLSTTAQRAWLREQRRAASDDEAGERSRRLETDSQAVQVMTIHAAKGLEFPVVLLPFTTIGRQPDDAPDVFDLHVEGLRAWYVGGRTGADYRTRLAQSRAEAAGEELRLLYVALTRASSQVVAWWAPTTRTSIAPLHRVLFRPNGASVPAEVPVPPSAAAWARLAALVADSDGCMSVTKVEREDLTGARPRWTPPTTGSGPLAVAAFDRVLDTAWRRTSYTGLTAIGGVHDGPHTAEVGSEPEEPGTTDEPAVPAPGEPAPPPRTAYEDRLRGEPSPWAALPAGATFGTLVHEILDGLAADAPDVAAVVLDRCTAAPLSRLRDPLDPDALAGALVRSLQTPLGDLAGGRRLVDIAARDRLDELGFELPMAGGDRAGGGRADADTDAVLADVAAALAATLPSDDPLAGYPDRLAAGELGAQRLRGYLLGSIDTVLRVPHPTRRGVPSFLVVDYKTNLLPADAGTLSAWHYRPAVLAEAMMAAHYPLQALLYDVALHRFLRWRLSGYDPAVHLGGVLYLFLRGMLGPASELRDAAGAVAGVFAWRMPVEAVLAVSDLLAGSGEGRQR